MTAREFNAARIASGEITAADVAVLGGESGLELAVRRYQRSRGLAADGRLGPRTLAVLRDDSLPRCWPARALADGRRPQITSGYRTADRPTHDGIDIMYPWREGDAWHYRHRYWHPGEVLAAAAGRVSRVAHRTSGRIVWLDHADGHRTGYLHLGDLAVAEGDVVVLGQPIAQLAAPAVMWPPHLHLERSPIGTYRPIDPAPWLAGAAVLPAR